MGKKGVYILNPAYNLKLDKNRIVIINRTNDPREKSFIGYVHPVYAVLLSQFDGKKTLSEIEEDLASLLKSDVSSAADIVAPLLENEEELYFHYDGYHLSFPERLLVKKSENVVPHTFEAKSFYIPKKDLDMESWRLHSPLDLLFVLNTRCITDCVYCYADRQKKMDCKIPLERLKEIIAEARELEMRSFDITGGEIFLYTHWEEILRELVTNGFYPYISTKIPIDLTTIHRLKSIGINRIQISIDSIIKDDLKAILGVDDDYLDRIKETFKNLDENDFEIFTNTQVNALNQDNILKLYDYLLTLKNIKRINAGAAGFSLYKGLNEYRDYKPDPDRLKRIETDMDELKEKYEGKININFSGAFEGSKLIDTTPEEKKEEFRKRSRCSANFYAFVLLPDGKVTLCEELYWHPRFIIGDLTKQSIKEMWNSEKALELYRISREMVRDESECKTCDEFDSCHRYKGICWKEVLYAYGYENWDYPDPKCPRAIYPTRKYFL